MIRGGVGRGFDRLRSGLRRTRERLAGGVRGIVTRGAGGDEEMWEELEELLLGSDVGVEAAGDLVAAVRKSVGPSPDAAQLLGALREAVSERLGSDAEGLALEAAGGPAVILMVGVNGVGKTTTAAKLAGRLSGEGRRVVLAACDTYRAAAVEQLVEWAERLEIPIVRGQQGADAAAVAFDALDSAIGRQADVLIVDTAGRLHTQSNLMEELSKVSRVLAGRLPGAPHETLLVLDATTGQNALAQARAFGEVGVTGLVLAKLDGTARGGVVLAIRQESDVPVKLVGVGEDAEDLHDFDPAAFARALVPEPAESA